MVRQSFERVGSSPLCGMRLLLSMPGKHARSEGCLVWQSSAVISCLAGSFIRIYVSYSLLHTLTAHGHSSAASSFHTLLCVHTDPLPGVCARAAATGACRGGLPGAEDCDGWVSGALRAVAYAARECGALESGRGAARQPHPYRWMRLRACDACSRPSRRGGESGAGRLRRGRPGEKGLAEHMSLEDRWAPVQFDQ